RPGGGKTGQSSAANQALQRRRTRPGPGFDENIDGDLRRRLRPAHALPGGAPAGRALSYAWTMRPTSGWRTTSAAVKRTWAMPATFFKSSDASMRPDTWPGGRSI